MKWILIAGVLLVVFALFRRMGRESKVAFWEQRPGIPFDEFYQLYYANSGLDKEPVRMALHMVARATEVPADKLRPEDRMDELKPGALNMVLAILQRVDSTGVLERAGMPHPTSWKADTVDALIRLFAPYCEHIKVTTSNDFNS